MTAKEKALREEYRDALERDLEHIEEYVGSIIRSMQEHGVGPRRRYTYAMRRSLVDLLKKLVNDII